MKPWIHYAPLDAHLTFCGLTVNARNPDRVTHIERDVTCPLCLKDIW